jgi:hypothetical protein
MIRKLLFIMGLMVLAPVANASLSVSYQFNGNGNWSIDGCGSNTTSPNVCDISAEVPTGSTIEAAFLYSSLTPSASLVSVDFDGTVINALDWTNLGSTGGLTAYRTDVTTQVAAKIGGGSASPFTFSIDAETPNSRIDGEVLAIIYSNPAEDTQTIAILDGFSAQGGDTAALNLASALTPTEKAALAANMSLAIGFGNQGDGQRSEIDVNGVNLTTCAGGQDDGRDMAAANGNLITVGGLGDDPSNNHDCTQSGPRQDDELYDLAPFVNVGDTQIVIDTINPSNDDNIFFAAFKINLDADVVSCEDSNSCPDPDPKPVPEPGTLLLFGLGLLGMASRFRKSV